MNINFNFMKMLKNQPKQNWIQLQHERTIHAPVDDVAECSILYSIKISNWIVTSRKTFNDTNNGIHWSNENEQFNYKRIDFRFVRIPNWIGMIRTSRWSELMENKTM